MIEIHVSDRVLFKRCRRKWGWQSPLRGRLEPLGASRGALWYGTLFHKALADYHGYREHTTPSGAFLHYISETPRDQLPDDWEELRALGIGMLDYYEQHWLPQHDEYQTLWVNGVPQVEVSFSVPIPGFDPNEVRAVGTFDRVCVDADGRLWVMDYKTTKMHLDRGRLELDPQVTMYTWAATRFYEEMFEGVIWQQHLKATPEAPARLKRGGFSQNKSQHTSHALYHEALMEEFGHIPDAYVEFLNYLAAQGDRYVWQDIVRRNAYQLESEEWKLFEEVRDMMDPDLPLYPNPTRDCSWDCPFRSPCLALDDTGPEAAQDILDSEFGPSTHYPEESEQPVDFFESAVL